MDGSSLLISGLVGGVAGAIAGFLARTFKAGRYATLACVVVAGLAAGLGWRAFEQRPMSYDRVVESLTSGTPVTGMERYLRAWALATKAHPEIRHWFESTPGMKPDERELEIQLKTRSGLNRLSDEQLVQRMELLSRMVERAEATDCAAVGRGDLPQESLGRLVNGMDDASLQRFSDIVASALAAELRQSPEPRTSAEEDVTQAFVEINSGIGSAQAQRLADNLQDLGALTDEEACWTTRTLYRQGSALQDRDRRTLALALTND